MAEESDDESQRRTKRQNAEEPLQERWRAVKRQSKAFQARKRETSQGETDETATKEKWRTRTTLRNEKIRWKTKKRQLEGERREKPSSRTTFAGDLEVEDELT